VISDGMLADVRLGEFDCVYLCNVALLTEREVNLLEQYVNQGGGLVVVLGNAVRPANYNELLYGDRRQLLPGRLVGVTGDLDGASGGFRFNAEDYSHPILAPFEGNETAGLLTTRIDRYVQTEPGSDPAAHVVLRYSSGDAAILERTYGDGRVMLVTTALDDHWGNWALWPSFVPMMHELTRYAAAGDFGRRGRLVGERIVRRIRIENRSQAAFVLESSTAEVQQLQVRLSNSAAEIVSPPLRTRGAYALRLGGPDDRIEQFVVNIDPAESDLAKIESETLRTLFPPQSEFRYLRTWQPRTAGTSGEQLARNSLTTWFLTAALCLLLVEQLMAWRFVLGVIALGLVILAVLVSQLTDSRNLAGAVAGLVLAGIVAWWGMHRRRSGVQRRSGLRRFT
jgi:hypothetical protein